MHLVATMVDLLVAGMAVYLDYLLVDKKAGLKVDDSVY